MVEPEIVINGTRLNFAQAMTVRVAVEIFASHIAETPKRERPPVYEGYMARIHEIREFIFANQPKTNSEVKQ
jgi:hypothetical protein